MVHFVGAGCGAVDLITVRGARLLSEADVVIYAGSLVNPELLNYCKPGCEIHNSAKMTLAETTAVIVRAEAEGKTTVRLHTGDSTMCLYLSTRLTQELQQELLEGGYPGSTPVAIVFKASWPDERIFHCTVDTLHKTVTENDLTRTSLIIVGDCMGEKYAKSYLYDPSYDRPFHEAATK